ncbi:MAG: LPXTG cell wall anchor domain-containing protein, partial [Oscillospiraceae bacterium]
KEEDVGYRIYVVANAAGSTAAGVQSPRTEPVWAICSEVEGSSYNPGEDLVFRFNGALSSVITTKPIMVAKVGGKEVALKQSDYTIKSGSTVVTLKDSFLKTLSAGNYTLGVNYLNNVKAEARFTIKDGKPTPKPDEQPKTGDDSNLWLWVLLSSGAFLGLGTTLYLRKKQVK